MAAIDDFRNGSGLLYITEADGTTIITSEPNDEEGGLSVLQDALTSTAIPAANSIYDTNFGHRYFINSDENADPEDLTGSTEISANLIKQGLESHIDGQTVEVTDGVGGAWLIPTRNGVVTVVGMATGIEGSDLNIISTDGFVDNDILILVGDDRERIVTVKNYDSDNDNIYLANELDFETGDLTNQLTLRFKEGNWYELFRTPGVPLTVANLRAKGIAIPVQGVETTELPTSGTINIEAGVDKGVQVFTGSPTLVASINIRPNPTPTTAYLDGDRIEIIYNATPTVGSNAVTIFGITLTDTQAESGKIKVVSVYKLSNTTWYSTIFNNVDGVDFATTAQVAAKEDSLGNPAYNGYVLSSQTNGTRAWVAPLGGVQVATYQLSSVQLLDIFDTPITIIPDVGADSVIDIISVAGRVDYGTTAYAGDPLILVNLTTNTTLASFSAGFTTTTETIPIEKASIEDYTSTDTENIRGVKLTTTSGDWTTGDGTITVTILYRVITTA